MRVNQRKLKRDAKRIKLMLFIHGADDKKVLFGIIFIRCFKR